MAFCTRCGVKLEEGVEHVCAEVQKRANQVAETAKPVIHSAGQGNAGEFFSRLWQQIRKGIVNPDGLASELLKSRDYVNPVIHYVIFGLTYGLFSAAFTTKLANGLLSFMSNFFDMFSGGGNGLSDLYDSGIMQANVPFGSILFKTAILMVVVGMAYAVSFALISKLFRGRGEVGDYFKAIAGSLVPVSLTLIIAAIVVNATIILGAIAFLVAFIYLCYFPILQAYKLSTLSVAKMVYTLPLVHVIPAIVCMILVKMGL